MLYFYIFWMTLCILVFIGVVANAIRERLENNERKCCTHWKPNKEQLDTLKFIIGNHIFGHQEHQGILESLYNDLKKL